MKNNKNIILLGGGGHCKSVIDEAESAVCNIVGICMKSIQTSYHYLYVTMK